MRGGLKRSKSAAVIECSAPLAMHGDPRHAAVDGQPSPFPFLLSPCRPAHKRWSVCLSSQPLSLNHCPNGIDRPFELFYTGQIAAAWSRPHIWAAWPNIWWLCCLDRVLAKHSVSSGFPGTRHMSEPTCSCQPILPILLAASLVLKYVGRLR